MEPELRGTVGPAPRHFVRHRKEVVMIADSNEDLLTAAEVASLLRMTSGWVYAETRANRIPHLRLGRYVRYWRSAIEQWMGEIETAASHVFKLSARWRASARRRTARRAGS